MSSDKQIQCEILSWNRVARDAKRLANLVTESGYKLDIAVAIARGGLVPARILSDYLSIRDLTTIKVEHWGITATPSEKAVIKFPLCVDIKDKNVLLIDDTTDTGDTLKVSIEYLKNFTPGEIRTATLIHKTCSKVEPDFFVRKVMKWKWIIFPWHIWEDLTEFVRRIADSGIHNEEDIKRRLEEQYNIKIKIETVREVLSELMSG
ncbi:MAG: phosphoribosyltransferase [Nitrospiraceae bacterium]|nr:MAG: phosphoribosyltransferase [Nitrospiraceae bacterium]